MELGSGGHEKILRLGAFKENRMSSTQLFADYVTLVYHEARYLTELDTPEVKLLCQKLSKEKCPNRYVAWKVLQPLRQTATRLPTANSIHALFTARLGVSLERVAVLFGDRRWDGRGVGGKRWADAARKLVEIEEAIEAKQTEVSERLFAELFRMEHNSRRTLKAKLEHLDASLTSRR
jgi:hypothetical protein